VSRGQRNGFPSAVKLGFLDRILLQVIITTLACLIRVFFFLVYDTEDGNQDSLEHNHLPGTRQFSCLKHYAASRKVAGSIPHEVTGFFN
jgi:hypothetical protein